MAIVPLRFWRRIMYDDNSVGISDNNHEGSSAVLDTSTAYGRGEYITNDGRFNIKQTSDGWQAEIWDEDKYRRKSFRHSGIGNATFTRRRDLILALQSFLQSEGITS